MLWTKISGQQKLNQPLKQLRRRCKMPALILWQAVAEDRPEGTPTEEQDPQRRQHPHQKPHLVDRSTVAAKCRAGTAHSKVLSRLDWPLSHHR